MMHDLLKWPPRSAAFNFLCWLFDMFCTLIWIPIHGITFFKDLKARPLTLPKKPHPPPAYVGLLMSSNIVLSVVFPPGSPTSWVWNLHCSFVGSSSLHLVAHFDRWYHRVFSPSTQIYLQAKHPETGEDKEAESEDVKWQWRSGFGGTMWRSSLCVGRRATPASSLDHSPLLLTPG